MLSIQVNHNLVQVDDVKRKLMEISELSSLFNTEVCPPPLQRLWAVIAVVLWTDN